MYILALLNHLIITTPNHIQTPPPSYFHLPPPLKPLLPSLSYSSIPTTRPPSSTLTLVLVLALRGFFASKISPISWRVFPAVSTKKKYIVVISTQIQTI